MLTYQSPTSSELAGVGADRRNSASCDETGGITFSFFVHLSFVFFHHSPLLLLRFRLRFYDGARSAPALRQEAPVQIRVPRPNFPPAIIYVRPFLALLPRASDLSCLLVVDNFSKRGKLPSAVRPARPRLPQNCRSRERIRKWPLKQ